MRIPYRYRTSDHCRTVFFMFSFLFTFKVGLFSPQKIVIADSDTSHLSCRHCPLMCPLHIRIRRPALPPPDRHRVSCPFRSAPAQRLEWCIAGRRTAARGAHDTPRHMQHRPHISHLAQSVVSGTEACREASQVKSTHKQQTTIRKP